MGYITFLDLLGTKDFCGAPEIYNTNISIFYKEAQANSYRLKGVGKIGTFSHCLYAESKELRPMLDFLVSLRKSLCAQKLFFNAALTKGEIGIVNPTCSRDENFFGVAFERSDIASLYMKQNQFKGIGIWVDKELYSEINAIKSYRLVRSVFLPDVNAKRFQVYYDIAFELKNKVYDKYEVAVVKRVFNECLLAYTKSRRYGRYYLSIIATLINSYKDNKLSWNLLKSEFDQCPLIYSIVMRLAEDNGKIYPIIQGLDMLCLLIVDNVFKHKEITEIDRSRIVKKFMSFECLKKPYAYSINDLPEDVFSEDINRKRFIQIYQENIVNAQVDDLFRSQE